MPTRRYTLAKDRAAGYPLPIDDGDVQVFCPVCERPILLTRITVSRIKGSHPSVTFEGICRVGCDKMRRLRWDRPGKDIN